jgi:hypothetical protein
LEDFTSIAPSYLGAEASEVNDKVGPQGLGGAPSASQTLGLGGAPSVNRETSR